MAKETGVAVERLEIKGFMCHFWPNGQFVTTFLRVYVSTDVVKLNSEKSDF